MNRLAIISSLLVVLTVCGCGREYTAPKTLEAPIYPDYTNVTIPCNMAPLNFDYAVEVGSGNVTTFVWDGGETSFKGNKVRWNMRRWKKMLEQAKGGDITVRSSALDTAWTISVSSDVIDYGITYRLIEPGYEVYSKMGIYERNLSDFTERALIENTGFDGCVNCHSTNRGDPSAFSLHIRGDHGATLIKNEGQMRAYNTKTDSTLGTCVYPYWHPEGRYIAYSTNSTHQGFHTKREKIVEVFDLASDIQVYDTRKNELITAPQVKVDSLWETFPVFSPDGRTIYFCRAEGKPVPEQTFEIRYNLYKVGFDPENGTIGNDIQLVVDAESMGKSISFPKPSYDGKYLMYTLSDYGQFSIWHHEADLWLLDLSTGASRPLTSANSPDTESYHNFSSNSKWFVFSSRRDDGLFTRLYFSHLDQNGNASKPFMLPQKNPLQFYATGFLSFNVPEFVNGAVELDETEAYRQINSSERENFSFRK